MTQENKTKITPEEKAQAVKELWMRGVLSFKLDKCQKELYNLYHEATNKTNVWLLSRRAGKTRTLLVLALEQCIKQPRSIVKILSPTKLQLNNNIRPLMSGLLDDCPNELKPSFITKDYIYFFPNGSEIHLAGTDKGHAEKLRGGDSHAWFIDEAGSCDDLENIVNNILIPTTLITKGKGVLASTPPSEPEHAFLKFIEVAETRGTLVKKTIYDNPRITEKDIEEMAEELGGKQTDAFRRECLCEIIKSSSISVLPDVTQDLLNTVTKEWPRPPYFETHAAMDLGFDDLTVVLFGYYDFRADKIIIEDEICYDFNKKDEKNNTANDIGKLTSLIDSKEVALWTNIYTNEIKRPISRVSDINKIVQNEIRLKSKNVIDFQCANKDDKLAAINTLRTMLLAKKIIIHPRCKTLIAHLINGRWRSVNDRSNYARSPDNGHYDAIDALIYFVRHLQFTKNPYPSTYGMNLKDLHVQNPAGFEKTHGGSEALYKSIFGRKKVYGTKRKQ